MITLTQADLNDATCHYDDCTEPHPHPLYLHGRCHPEAGTRALYTEGVLILECMECRRDIAKLAVAVAASIPLNVVSTAVRHLSANKPIPREEIAAHLAHYFDANLGRFDRHAFIRECGAMPPRRTFHD